MSADFEKFLRGKTALAVIKADVRAGMAHAINMSSEAVLRQAINNLKATTEAINR